MPGVKRILAFSQPGSWSNWIPRSQKSISTPSPGSLRAWAISSMWACSISLFIFLHPAVCLFLPGCSARPAVRLWSIVIHLLSGLPESGWEGEFMPEPACRGASAHTWLRSYSGGVLVVSMNFITASAALWPMFSHSPSGCLHHCPGGRMGWPVYGIATPLRRLFSSGAEFCVTLGWVWPCGEMGGRAAGGRSGSAAHSPGEFVGGLPRCRWPCSGSAPRPACPAGTPA